jgi:tRNA(Ile)-lysidine synthase
MHQFLTALREGCLTCELAGQSVLIAVSGGADSVALLRGLLQLRTELALELRVAHLNHRLRGDAAEEDARWIAEICGRFDLPVTIGTAEVRELADEGRNGLEEAARRARYAFLEQTAAAHGCRRIAVAHTADDQAETILHHILRGTGLAGLRGMPGTRPLKSGAILARPLLGVGRQEGRSFLTELGQEFREDRSNSDPSFTRNRIRIRLLPLLEDEFNPRIGAALRKLGAQAADLHAQAEHDARELLRTALLDATPDLCRLACDALQAHPRHRIRECFTLLWRRQNWARRQMGFDHWDRLAEIACQGGAATLPGPIRVTRRGNLLLCEREMRP